MIDRILEILAALAIFGVIFIVLFATVLETTIESVKQRANNLNINCSNAPVMNAAKISLDQNVTIYCQITEPNN